MVVAASALLIALPTACSSDDPSSDPKDSTSASEATTTAAGAVTTAAPTTAAPTTAPVRPEVPVIPDGVSPEPDTVELPDGIYTAQVNSYDNENQSLNLNLVRINNDVFGPDGKPYLIEDLDLFTLRDLPLARNRKLFLLPDGGGWTVGEVTDTQEFFSALANRDDRPTPWDANQNSVFAISVVGGEITQVMQIFLP